ncbi:MAG: hypothetical protein Q8L48_43090 [Archangium sp.]|nr:hypothetical protein [Archangium sp.]
MSALKDDELRMALKVNPATATRADEPPLDDGVLLAFRAGTLSPDQSEAIERRLSRDPEARALLRELSQEVSPAEVEAVVDRLGPSNVLPLRRKPRALVWGSAVMALAAGLLAVVVAWPARNTGRYLLEVEGGEAQTRGAPAQKRVVGEEGRLTLRLRAQTATDAPRVLGVFREDEQGRLVRVDTAQVSSARGSFEVRLEGAQWLGAAGAHRIWLHVGEDEAAVAALAGRLQRDAAGAGLGWWAIEVERRAP